MKDGIIKGIVILFLFSIWSLCAQAQLGYNFNRFEVGAFAGANQVFGDVGYDNTGKTPITLSGGVTLSYSPTSPFVNLVLDIQAGRLKGGDALRAASGREFTNDFYAGSFRAQVQAGEFIDYSRSQFANALKNVYLSAGLGVINNNMKFINRTSNTTPLYYTPGKNNSTEFYIPARVGYEIKLYDSYGQPSIKIDLAYQMNFMLGENIDGFEAGTKKDLWSQVVLGVKFALGDNTSYRKSISY